MAVRSGVHLIAHLDQQRPILVAAQTGIQAELGCDRFEVGGIVLLKAGQALLEPLQLGLLRLPNGLWPCPGSVVLPATLSDGFSGAW